MTALLVGLALLVAVGAAVRSTWSPCGLSMLSTITPLGERGRGRRFGVTAAWYVAGGILGGITLGAVAAGLAEAVRVLEVPGGVRIGVAVGAALVAAASDGRLGGFSLPIHRRQVNELWLDRFRSWVYGLGFGWQIGTGYVTYIMTAALSLAVVLAALTGSPPAALAVGTVFGLVRGLAVLLGRGIVSPAALTSFHRGFAAAGEPVRRALVGVELAVAVTAPLVGSLTGIIPGPVGPVLAGGALLAGGGALLGTALGGRRRGVGVIGTGGAPIRTLPRTPVRPPL
jgi:hypothetical protein